MNTLKVTGSPAEQGQQHGEHFRDKILELCALRRELFYGYFDNKDGSIINPILMKHIKTLKNYPEYYLEFKGISQAANVSETDLLILNAYTDLRDFADSKLPLDDGGCSTFSVANKHSSICGQSWDMHASAEPYLFHLSSEGEVNKEILTLTGCLAMAGVNQFGVSILVNNLFCTDVSFGLAWPSVVRGLLDQKNALESYQFLTKNIPSSGHNYLICGPIQSMSVETTGNKTEVVSNYQTEGNIFHTNHYLSELSEHENKNRMNQSTFPRYDKLSQFFSQLSEEPLDIESLGNCLFSTDGESSVFVNKTKEPNSPMTCGGILVDIKNRTGVSFVNSFSLGDHHRFSWK